MDKKELQKAQNIIDALFYDDKALTGWQHKLLENVISIAQTKLPQPDVSGRSELLKAFVEWQIQGNTPYAGMLIDEHIRAYFKSL